MRPSMLATSAISAHFRRGSGGAFAPFWLRCSGAGGRVAPALAVGTRSHGRPPGRGQALDGLPLLACAEHRQLGAEQVLGDLAPADAAVDLDEETAPGHFCAQSAATFQLAVDLALQGLDRDKGILAGPQAFKGFSHYQLHGRVARMMSAACCGMEYRSARSA